MNPTAIPFLLLGLCASASAQHDGKQEPQKADQNANAEAVLKDVLAQFEKENVRLDAKAGTVTIPAVVNKPRDAIEYLLIHKKGKRHEAVFYTLSKPSVLNAALLMIGLEPGQNATYEEKDPPPTLEEIQKGADPLIVKAPKGRPFWMTVKWKDENGKVVEHCVEDMLLDLTTRRAVEDCEWIYMGGRMAQLYKGDPEVYIADFEGNLVSVCYLAPDNHLGTMSHERARDDTNWLTTGLLPEDGTEVEFVFHKTEPPIHVERRKRVLAEKKQRAAAEQGGDGKKD